MPTLYEILGALPEDDADSLREAFRKAAKASHPDNNPGDADAPQRFRQIVRAHAILKDERQRAAYDWLLTQAQQPRAPDSRRRSFSGNGLPGPISGMVIASVSIGAFMLIERAFTAPAVRAQLQHISAQALVLTEAMPTQASNTVGKASDKASDHDKPETVSSAKAPENASTVEAVAAPVVAATVDKGGDMASMSEPAVKDARFYLERGKQAYGSGDLPLALTDFDLAINLDPNSSDAYVNRAIVFRRMGDLKHALADVNQAKRIDEGKPR